MALRSALRSLAFDLRWTAPSTTSTAAPLWQRACLHQTASLQTATEQPSSQPSPPNPDTPLSATPRAQSSEPKIQQGSKESSNSTANPFHPVYANKSEILRWKKPVAPIFASHLRVPRSLLSQLPHLVGQAPHYIVAELHGRPYLLTAGDHIRLPFLMPNVKPGDILRFNRASALGSRDFTLKGATHIDERLFECRVRVTGTESEPLRIKEKTKRRRRHIKRVKSKHRYTMMTVMDVRVKSPDELLRQGAVVVEDAEGAPEIEART